MRIARLFLLLFLSMWLLPSSAQKIKVTLASTLKEVNEQCALLNNEMVQFKLDSIAKTGIVYNIRLSGTASKGNDYATNMPDSIRFNIGDSVKLFDLTVFNDRIEEGAEQIIIIASRANNSDTFTLNIVDHVIRILTTQDTFRVCSNEPFNLPIQKSTGATLTWNPADLVKPTADPGVFIISPLRTTSIVVTGLALNCVERDTIYIISQPIGVTLNTRDTVYLCFPDSTRLIATTTPSNANVTWRPLDSTTRVINNTTIQVKLVKSAQYIVNVTSGVCKAADTVFVRIDSLRDTKINVFPKKDKYCKGDSIFFFSQRHPKDLFPSIKPSWSPSNGFQTSKDTFNAVIMADVTTTYVRTTTNNACKHTDSVFIKVIEPSIPVGPVDTVVCPGTTIQITFKKDSSEYKDFKWTPQDGLISCEKCSDPKIKVNGMQMYKVEAKKDGCDATTEIKVNVHQKPSTVRLSTDPAPPFTAGNDIRITLLGTETMRAVAWRVDGRLIAANTLTATIVKATPGNHPVEVEVTDRFGCMWTYNFTLVVICPPSGITLQRTPLGTIYEGTNLTINATGISPNVTSIKWSVNGNSNPENTLILKHKPNAAGNVVYRFEAIDVNGCPIAASITVQVIPCITPEELRKKIPNAFSPNGDQKNDVFNYSDGSLRVTKLLVYSRWGQLVYNNTNPEIGWDGRINGADGASDVYIYRITYICGDGGPQEVSGTITLLR